MPIKGMNLRGFDMDQNRKEGMVLMAVSGVLALAAIFMSEGWYPAHGFFWSLGNTMTLYDGYPFGCESIKSEPLWLRETKPDCSDSLHIIFATRYAFLFLLAISLYGAGIYQYIVPSISTLKNRITTHLKE